MPKITHAQAYTPALVNVLIACEESQAECKAFREAGFNAFSCDLQNAHGGHPEWHIHGNVMPLLYGRREFSTEDGERHRIDKFHLIIAHPPCTYLCKVSSVHMMVHGVLNEERYAQMLEARRFFMRCLNAKADYLAVENPLPMARAELPQPSCYLQPSWFGVKIATSDTMNPAAHGSSAHPPRSPSYGTRQYS